MCITTVLSFLRSNRKFYLKNHTQNNFFSPPLVYSSNNSRCDLGDLLFHMESRAKRIAGELWERILFSNLHCLFPILKAQLDNIYKYPSGFGFANFIFSNACFSQCCLYFQPLRTDVTCPVT